MRRSCRRPSLVSCLTYLLISSILFTIYELIAQFWSPRSRTNLYNLYEGVEMLDGYIIRYDHRRPGLLDNALTEWSSRVTEACDGHFIGYSDYFIRLHHVALDKRYGHAEAVGGVDLDLVQGQNDSAEMYTFKRGFYHLPCNGDKPRYHFIPDHQGHMRNWLNSLKCSSKTDYIQYLQNLRTQPFVVTNFTIALVRYEYHNVYWTIIDVYNVFLTAAFLNKTVAETSVLLVDEHPKGNLDVLLKEIFNTRQLHEFPKVTLFHDLVWAPSRHHNPMLGQHRTVPLVPEFQRAVLKQFSLQHEYTRNCLKLNILLIWRRDYRANPRQLKVSRKIRNEEEVLSALNSSFSERATITALQLDLLTVRQQLQLFSTSDIVLGMHGAAFAYTLFMPPDGAVIELFPRYSAVNWHMRFLAHWAKIQYLSWQNRNKTREDEKNGFTTMSPAVPVTLVHKAIKKICHTQP